MCVPTTNYKASFKKNILWCELKRHKKNLKRRKVKELFKRNLLLRLSLRWWWWLSYIILCVYCAQKIYAELNEKSHVCTSVDLYYTDKYKEQKVETMCEISWKSYECHWLCFGFSANFFLFFFLLLNCKRKDFFCVFNLIKTI